MYLTYFVFTFVNFYDIIQNRVVSRKLVFVIFLDIGAFVCWKGPLKDKRYKR